MTLFPSSCSWIPPSITSAASAVSTRTGWKTTTAPSVRISTSTPTCSLRRLPTVRLGYVSISGWNVSENASFLMTRTLRSICVVLVIPTPNPARISVSLRKNSIPVSTSRNSIRRALRTTGTSATTTRWSVRPLFQRQGQGAAQLRGTAPKHLG